ncbi:MAG: hypothetical protein ACREDJ_07500, partial [Methylocella sp.]
MKRFYERLVGAGKAKMVALIALYRASIDDNLGSAARSGRGPLSAGKGSGGGTVVEAARFSMGPSLAKAPVRCTALSAQTHKPVTFRGVFNRT